MSEKIYGFGNIIKIVLEIISIIGVLILLLLYPITKYLGVHFDLFILMIYPCGISFLFLVYQFIQLFNSLKNKNPFCYENVQRFRNSMYSSIIICILIIVALLISIFIYNYYSLQLKYALGFISFLFFCFTICFYVLSELFKQATEYKTENDLTI